MSYWGFVQGGLCPRFFLSNVVNVLGGFWRGGFWKGGFGEVFLERGHMSCYAWTHIHGHIYMRIVTLTLLYCHVCVVMMLF